MCRPMKKAREAAGLSQKQVALELKVSAPTVSDWEAEKISPNAKNLKQLSDLYGTTTDYLLGVHGMFSAYMKKRAKCLDLKELSEKYQIDAGYLSYILGGSEKPSGGSMRQASLGTDDIRRIAEVLKVDFIYLACLYDGINPHKVNGVRIPDDDLTENLNFTLLDINLQLFGNAAPTGLDGLDEEEALLLENYRSMNNEGQEKAADYLDDLVQSGKYKKHDTDRLGREA